MTATESPATAEPEGRRPVGRALLSVSDKTGIVSFARSLAAFDIEIASTGGTAGLLIDAGLPVRDMADLTGYPEMMDGRVKALHPAVFGGLLARRDRDDHRTAMADHDIPAIDLLVVNLYPFETVAAGGADFDQCIETIDVGGFAMIRAAAKNHHDVVVVVDQADYAAVLQELADHGGATTAAFRRRLAAKAFARTAAYEVAIAGWFSRQTDDAHPNWFAATGTLSKSLRYGENPHQTAAFYHTGEQRPGVATARQVQGKQLSYNNINDTDAAFDCVAEFHAHRVAACVIVKHANPCGVAEEAELLAAYQKALSTDPQSAFGGVVAVNRPLDAPTAEAISAIFTEVVIAPDASEEALAILSAKSNLRLLLTGSMPDPKASGLTFRSVAGGILAQSRDNAVVDDMDLRVVSKRAPDARELADLKFAFRVAKHARSNAIVYARNGATLGIGAGQSSRVESARIGIAKAAAAARQAGLDGKPAEGAVVASDAFYPFADGLMVAIEAGVTAAIHQGGSVRDDEVIAAADDHGIAMIMTGMRLFRH